MTPESQRIAIAEACGWKEVWKSKHDGKIYGLEPTGVRALELPYYLNDLNAMHEAEKVLFKNVDLYLDYGHCLTRIGGGAVDALFTTSAQRAQAFLMTLGLWK